MQKYFEQGVRKMNQLENNSRNRSASPGRSRAKGADRGRSASGRASSRGTSSRNTGHGGSRSSSSYRSGQAGRMNAMQNVRRNSRRHRRKGPDYKWIAIGGVILIVVITCIAMALNGKNSDETGVQATTEAVTETEMKKEVSVDGISITGLSKSQAREVLLKEFPWSMTVSYDSEVYEVNDLMAGKIDSLLNEIYSGEPQESYTLDTAGLEEQIKAEAAACAAKWDKKAKNGSIDSFNAETGKFVFAGEENGFAIDQEKLIDDITQALAAKDFDAKIEASGSTVAPEITAASAKEQYKTIGSFTTNTTSNKNRNTNVRLAAEAINGTVIKPGHEFSFNGTVGQRTEAKGYKGAAAYNNGEVVQEIGGGVCQVSTTLYNAVYRSGLGEESITFRRSHTFEPNYITPGQDATVSWEQPDFRFVNTSSAPIGIRASYADRKATVSIYGLPVLEEGVSWDLYSEKVEELPPPEPEYAEDPSLEPGTEKVVKAAVPGSRWDTYKVISKDGEERERILDHSKTYKGHAAVIHRNTASSETSKAEQTPSAAPYETKTGPEHPASSDPAPAETLPSDAPFVDGMPDSYTPKTNPIIPFQPTASS